MGKNTPSRQEFIIDNLRVEKDEAVQVKEPADDDEPVGNTDEQLAAIEK